MAKYVRIFLHSEATKEQLLLKFPELPLQFCKIADEARVFHLENPKWIVKTKDNEEYIVTCMRDIMCLIEDRIVADPECIHLYLREKVRAPPLNEALLGYRVTLSECPVHQAVNNGAGPSEQNKPGVRFAFGVAPDPGMDLRVIEEAVHRSATQHCYCAAFLTVPEPTLRKQETPQQK